MKNKFQNIIFDLDGTLIDSSPDIIKCLKMAYSLASINDVKITAYHIGPKLDKLISTLTPAISDNQREQVAKNYRQLYDNLQEKQSALYHGVGDGLRKLKEQGRNLYIATNKPHSATIPLLKNFSIYDLFVSVYTPTSIAGRELNKMQMIENIISTYSLNREDTVMVGDHHDDIHAAKANNISSIAILYGYSTKDHIQAAGADFEIENFSDILLL